MERRGPTPGSGSYGKACRQCSKAKCRCVARPDGAGCERCLRLKKQCQPSESTRRKSHRVPESGAQIAKLEGRIDSLTAMLQSVAHATGVSSNLQTSSNASTGDNISSLAITGTDIDRVLVPQPWTTAPSQSTTIPSPSNGPSQPSVLLPPLYELNLEKAAWYLNRFTTNMLPCFPFICLPPNTTTQQLHQDRPFLLEAIIAVATPSTQEKLTHADRLKSRLTMSAMLENQSSIDMLLSILTYIAWSTDPFVKRASNLSRMIMLAISVVYDLQLDKKPLPPPEVPIIAKMAPGLGNPEQSASDNSLQEILEQHRAFLACFVLNSIISSTFRRTVPLPWTPQMEQALNLIDTNKEHPSDEYFTIQIRLQILAQKALSLRDPDETNTNPSTTSPTTPPATTMYLKLLHNQLTDLQSTIPLHLPHRDLLHLQTHYTSLLLHETPRLTSSSTPLLSSTTSPSPLTTLIHSLQAIKSWLSTFQTLPAQTITGFPFFMWFQLVRCIVLLKHLSTFEDPAWDRDIVRQEVDMLNLLEWMGEKAEMASVEAGEMSDDDLFRRVGRMLRLAREWVVRKVRGEADVGISGDGSTEGNRVMSGDEDRSGGSGVGSSSGGGGDGSSGMTGMDLDMTDMAWMHALESGDGGWLEEVLGWSPLNF
ncbi:C6 transcription factor [Aspergillus piperis CBS 112811]|uniref:C6 transcription factor n=1 Tax=Aspergillus piperis CBS 112811 TaxID=1448313 RepID=A0A8G1R0K2_9EURO|nr:C6 transcription factor [Aspergillus piperis CBS 112811]RAH56054.1 C6 transcription factor [Aspergillus piperis CBS 112811]